MIVYAILVLCFKTQLTLDKKGNQIVWIQNKSERHEEKITNLRFVTVWEKHWKEGHEGNRYDESMENCPDR